MPSSTLDLTSSLGSSTGIIGNQPGGVNAPGASVNYTGSHTLPTWLPTPDESIRELLHEYEVGDERSNQSIAALQQAGDEQQGHILTTAMNSANNAATEYANRNRQAGGNAAGAGLVRAQAQMSGQAMAGEAKVQQARDVMAAQERASALAGQIANNIDTLRTNYLTTLANFNLEQGRQGLEESRVNVERGRLGLAERELSLRSRMARDARRDRQSGTYQTDIFGRVSNLHGNLLEDNPLFNPTTGQLSHAGW